MEPGPETLELAGRLRGIFLASTVQRSGKAHLVAVLKLLLAEHLQAWLDDASLEDAGAGPSGSAGVEPLAAPPYRKDRAGRQPGARPP